MTIQQAKDQVARNKGFSNWQDLVKFQFTHLIARDRDEATKLYASEKVKEALQLAAERAEVVVETIHNNLTGTNREYHIVDEQSILSLETELINQINKEI